jgi:flagellar biosynthesis protein FlhB
MHHAFQYPANAMAMWTVVMAVMRLNVTRLDLAKCAKPMSFAVQTVVPALRRVLYVTSIRTVLMALMRSIVVSFHLVGNWFKHFAYCMCVRVL